MQHIKANRRGFTLVELLVVIVIIAILAGFLVVGVMAGMRPHPNVLQLTGLCSVKPPYCIITECMDCDMWSLLCSDVNIGQATMVLLAKGISNGLVHLHKSDIVHRDLAARNVLLKEVRSGWIPKISDFTNVLLNYM